MLNALKAWYGKATVAPRSVAGLRFPVVGLPAEQEFHFGIELVDDKRTPAPLVLQLLNEQAGYSHGDAAVAVAFCGQLGGVVLPSSSAEAAERAAAAVASAAKSAGYILACKAVAASGKCDP
jgi:ATP-dependent Clp protease adapter protein ClpS